MLCNLENILTKAMKEKYAVAQFNINNLEWTKFILEECETNKSPVILGVSEGAVKYMGGYNVVYNLVNSLIRDLKITIPVVLHLDHGSNIENCKKAIDAGFTSVMIDTSHLPIKENIENVNIVCEYAKKFNVTVEAEIGSIGGKEENNENNLEYASLDECKKLLEETNVFSIAPSLGTMHGIYNGIPKLNYKRMNEISTSLNIPLVLHGGSGLSDETIIECIKNGITKININTDLQISWTEAVRKYLNEEKNIYDPRKIISSGEKNIKNMVSSKLHLLGSCNKI